MGVHRPVEVPPEPLHRRLVRLLQTQHIDPPAGNQCVVRLPKVGIPPLGGHLI